MRMSDDDRAMISNLLVEGLRPTTISEQLGVDPAAVTEVAVERESLDMGTRGSKAYMAARRKIIDSLDIRITGRPPRALITVDDIVYAAKPGDGTPVPDSEAARAVFFPPHDLGDEADLNF